MLKPETILLVEDEALISMLLERQLLNLGCSLVEKVSSGEAALASAAIRRPDLVFMDIKIATDIDGCKGAPQRIDAPNRKRVGSMTAARLLCQAHPGIRVAFMTAYGTPLLRAEAQTVNPLIFLEKPLSLSDLELVLGLYARDQTRR